jgi:hypothetical protein
LAIKKAGSCLDLGGGVEGDSNEHFQSELELLPSPLKQKFVDDMKDKPLQVLH